MTGNLPARMTSTTTSTFPIRHRQGTPPSTISIEMGEKQASQKDLILQTIDETASTSDAISLTHSDEELLATHCQDQHHASSLPPKPTTLPTQVIISTTSPQQDHEPIHHNGSNNKTQHQLVHMLEEMRQCLQDTQLRLMEERDKRRTRTNSLFKLARELGRRRETIGVQAAQIEELRLQARTALAELELTTKKLQQLQAAHDSIHDELQQESQIALTKAQSMYEASLQQHQQQITELTRAHTKQREQLRLQVAQSDQELQILRQELQVLLLQNGSNTVSKRSRPWRRRRMLVGAFVLGGVCAMCLCGFFYMWAFHKASAAAAANPMVMEGNNGTLYGQDQHMCWPLDTTTRDDKTEIVNKNNNSSSSTMMLVNTGVRHPPKTMPTYHGRVAQSLMQQAEQNIHVIHPFKPLRQVGRLVRRILKVLASFFFPDLRPESLPLPDRHIMYPL